MITGITPAMRVATEEVFGPVALLFRVASADEALNVANGKEFGLGSSVWSNEPDEQLRFVERPGGGTRLRERNGRLDAPSSFRRDQELRVTVASSPPTGIREFCNIKAVSIP